MPSREEIDAFLEAVVFQGIDEMKEAFENVADGIDLNAPLLGSYAILDAACSSHDNVAKVEFLVSKGARLDVCELDANTRNILMIAIDHEDPELYDFFMTQFQSLNNELKAEILSAQNKDGLDALGLAVSEGLSEIVEDLLKNGANPNVVYKDGVTPLLQAALNNDKILCDALVKAGADISFKNKDGFNALHYAISSSFEDAAILLVNLGADPYERFEGRNVFAKAAIKNPRMDKFLGEFLKKDSIELLQDRASSCELLRLTYSQDDAGGYVNASINLLVREASKLSQKQEKFLAALKIIESGRPHNFESDKAIQIVELPYEEHAAFCIIEYQNGVPKTLSYCDGNLLLSAIDSDNHGYGIVTYEINPELAKSAAQNGQDFSAKLIKTFNDNPAVYSKDPKNREDIVSIGNLKTVLQQLTVCDKAGNPEIKSQAITTQRQDRGNCTIKSINLALRYILSKTNSEMVYEVGEDGRPYGLGHEMYKQFKYDIIKICQNDIIGATSSSEFLNKEEPIYSLILDSVKNMFLQAASKNNTILLEQLKEVLVQNNVNLTQLKSELRVENALSIAARHGKIEAFEWCLKNKIAPRVSDKDFFKYVARNQQMLEIFARHYLAANTQLVSAVAKYNSESLDLKDPVVFEIMENLAQENNEISNKIIEAMIARGADSNAKNADGDCMLLSWAMSSKNIDLITILLRDRNFDINVKDQDGTTLLHFVAGMENGAQKTNMMVFLVKKSADIYAQDELGMTALAYAVKSNDPQSVKLLLEKMKQTENVHEEDDLPFSPATNPLNIAYQKNNVAMMKLLVSHGLTATPQKGKEIAKEIEKIVESAPNNDKKPLSAPVVRAGSGRLMPLNVSRVISSQA